MKQQQRQMRDYLQRLALPQVQSMHSFSANVCSCRVMQYMYHLQQRPPVSDYVIKNVIISNDNGIAYWRKFVAEYYAPCAKKRWCLSSCYSARLHAIDVFSLAYMVRLRGIVTCTGQNLGEDLRQHWKYFAGNFVQGTLKSSCLEVQFYLRLLPAECELERNLDLQLVGDLRFSKRCVRCLQIADIFNCMKDLMTFSWDNKIEPIESLKKYSQKVSTTKLQKDQSQEKEQLGVPRYLPTDPNKLSTSHAPSGNSNDNSNMSKGGLLNSSDVVRHCIFPRQSCISSNVGELEQPSLLYERCDRRASSPPSQVPKTLS